ncbi:hypothetical protein [Ferrimonas aestuarii]|uniref:Uncharacterized protein n=1 Tax=Ferrimonas aestuarii TaxID=2569539 RepID=A0A4U1BJ36_9GAMM|nr:hypothetical protein [Ferrimonas aestuarii]TKB50105.1 hypothetical protein FCL42_19620 [Ferrimonas aestuarii]
MEWRLFVVFFVLIAGNCYWGYRYYFAQHNKNIDGRERMEQLDDIQDHWLQFSGIALMLIMLLTPLARQALEGAS